MRILFKTEVSKKDIVWEQDGISLKVNLRAGKENRSKLVMVRFITVIGKKELTFASWMETITMLFLNLSNSMNILEYLKNLQNLNLL